VVAVLLLIATALVTLAASGEGPTPPLATPDRALDALWNAYGDRGGHWTGGDRTASVPLPDGRVVWLFSDTFLGQVNRDGSRSASSPFINNSMVVESNRVLGPTLTGGDASAPQSLVAPSAGSAPGRHYWVADGTVAGNRLEVLYNMVQPVGLGGLNLQPEGTAVATFSLPDLRLVEVHPLPLSAAVSWGSSILADGDQTYIYGSEHNGSGPAYAVLARVPRGRLDGPWQFWTGHGWSSRETDMARLLTGVGTAFSVTRVGSQYVLVTLDTNLTFSRSIVAYAAAAPTGPFGPPTLLLDAPEAGAGAGATHRPLIVYDASAHPEQGHAGTLVISYNVNSLDPHDVLADARVYRPRFIDVAWPPRTTDLDFGPPAPSGLTATTTLTGTVHLGWSSSGPGVFYRLYQRDVSFGQTYFSRLPGTLARPAADAPYVRDGHTYEFRVSAVFAGLEGPPSPPLRLMVHMSRPPAPSGLRATSDTTGTVVLRWTAPPGAVWFTVYQRGPGQTRFQPLDLTDAQATGVSIAPLAQDQPYEFAVSASNGAGESPVSTVVTAKAHADLPPAPARLRATARPDGRVTLNWDARPGPGQPVSRAIEPGPPPVRFQVSQRDLTLGETSLRPWPASADAPPVEADTLRSGHTYEFTVAAVTAGGAGPPADPVQVTVTGGLPDVVAKLIATAGDGHVALKWHPVKGDGVEYVVYRRDLSTGEDLYTPLPLPALGYSFTDPTVHNGDMYLYRVVAANAHGLADPSVAVFAQPIGG
jgi:fibronectin type III domain protein